MNKVFISQKGAIEKRRKMPREREGERADLYRGFTNESKEKKKKKLTISPFVPKYI